MKIKVTEIEANAEELRNSNTLAGGITDILRRCFVTPSSLSTCDDEEGEDENDKD